MARLKRMRTRWVIAAGAVVVLVGAVLATWPLLAKYTGAAPPEQFDHKISLEPTLKPDYRRVLGVAHNAGNNLQTTETALRNGAAVIEIDVKAARGQLAAGREQWWPWLSEQLFLGPALAEVWDESSAATSPNWT